MGQDILTSQPEPWRVTAQTVTAQQIPCPDSVHHSLAAQSSAAAPGAHAWLLQKKKKS